MAGLSDVFGTVVVISVFVVLTLLKGDPLYIGTWYYVSVFTSIFVLGKLIRTKPLFISGALVAAVVAFVVYLRAGWVWTITNDMLGLGHLCSLPGATVTFILMAIIDKYSKSKQRFRPFYRGFFGFGSGFLINQVVVCNTVLYCGALVRF